MSPQLAAALLFITVGTLYWAVQLRTGFFCKRYFLQIASLLSTGALGAWFVVLVLTRPERPTRVESSAAVVVALIALYCVALGLARFFFTPGGQLRSLGSLERSLARFTSPHTRLKLRTEDGVSIQVVHLRDSRDRRDTAIVVCHGGGRNKDIYANVITCELLFLDYDVLTYDIRGHQESGGWWTGDGDTKYDLKAVIDYARDQGYQKIGIVGRSFGAWTAIIEVAEFQNADAVVAAAPPPTDMRAVRSAKWMVKIGFKFWAFPGRAAARVFRGMRARKYDEHASLMNFVDRVSPCPLLIVCNQQDDAIGVGEDAFRELFEKAGEPKRLEVLKGTGHIYNWPNTYQYLTLLRSWLAETLG